MTCPTPCDDDCTAACHETHQVTRKREHDPETCGTRVTCEPYANRQGWWHTPGCEHVDWEGDGIKRVSAR